MEILPYSGRGVMPGTNNPYRWKNRRFGYLVTKTEGVLVTWKGYEMAWIALAPKAKLIQCTIHLSGCHKRHMQFHYSSFGFGMGNHWASHRVFETPPNKALYCRMWNVTTGRENQNILFRVESNYPFVIYHLRRMRFNVREASRAFINGEPSERVRHW